MKWKITGSDFLAIHWLCAWTFVVLFAFLDWFPDLVDMTHQFKVVSWLLSLGVNSNVVALQLDLVWLGLFAIALFLPWIFWVRSRARSANSEDAAGAPKH